MPPPDGASFMEKVLPDEVTLLVDSAYTPPPKAEAVLLVTVSVVSSMELLVPWIAPPRAAVFMEKVLVSLVNDPVSSATAPPHMVAMLPVNIDDIRAVTDAPKLPYTPPPFMARLDVNMSPFTVSWLSPAKYTPPPRVSAMLPVQDDPVDVTSAPLVTVIPPPTPATLLVKLHFSVSDMVPLVHTPPPEMDALLDSAVRATTVVNPPPKMPAPRSALFMENVDIVDVIREFGSMAPAPPPSPLSAVLAVNAEPVSVRVLVNSKSTPPPLPLVAMLPLKVFPAEVSWLADRLTAPPAGAEFSDQAVVLNVVVMTLPD
mmetsp:Transcript_22729/g.53900  ORF Transcript_22729/g.53900 Transcript_22729/m.53900 type:complete len:316 (-) Transcript_22729:493-1440(-)